MTHGKPATVGNAVERVERVARDADVELVADAADAELLVVLGGDGTMLRALHAGLTSGTPVIGVNFGRVGFLASIDRDDLERGLARVFAGEYRIQELSTLTARLEGAAHDAVNDVVVTSSLPGRMVELGWEVAGEDLGSQPCDGLICATPSGSTAYNLSNGGPVMMWGIDAMAMTFVAPHSLHARPLVVPRGLSLRVTNRTLDVPVTVLVDGRGVGGLDAGHSLDVGLGDKKGLLALLPEVTFFTRYHEVFP